MGDLEQKASEEEPIQKGQAFLGYEAVPVALIRGPPDGRHLENVPACAYLPLCTCYDDPELG